MSRKVFLDTGIFFDCLESPDKRSLINHAINRDYQFFTSLTVIGEVILIMKRDAKFAEHLTGFFSLLTEWKIAILVPTDDVAVICYEFSQDLTDGRMISQKTDRTHLAYAIAYDCDYLITSDDALIRYRIPLRLRDSDYVKPNTLPLDGFRKVVMS
ncbi:type II toxin-antitoxin system VapC family toxin [Methanoregula sp.]|uniref:type II toxin-antitoxin system VapC family toxin n=1 Tax=Methanoregula sp. TaxID=2052170 RepID=UPI003FD71EA8